MPIRGLIERESSDSHYYRRNGGSGITFDAFTLTINRGLGVTK